MIKRLIVIIPIIAISFTALRTFLGLYVADVYFEKSQDALQGRQLDKAIEFANLAVDRNPLEPNYYRGRAKVYIVSLLGLDEKTAFLIKNNALSDLQEAYKLNTHNLVTIRNVIPLYYFLAAKDLSKPASTDNVDERFLPVTRDFYRKIKDVSPNDVGVCVLLAKYEKRLGLMDDYEESIQKIKDLRPDLLQWNPSLRE